MKILFFILVLFFDLIAEDMKNIDLKYIENNFYKIDFAADFVNNKCLKTTDFVKQFTGKNYPNNRLSFNDFYDLNKNIENKNIFLKEDNNEEYIYMEILKETSKNNFVFLFFEKEEICNEFIQANILMNELLGKSK